MLHSGCVKRHQKSRDFVGLPMGLLREGSPKKRMNTGLLGSRSGEYGLKAARRAPSVQQAIIDMNSKFIVSKFVCFTRVLWSCQNVDEKRWNFTQFCNAICQHSLQQKYLKNIGHFSVIGTGECPFCYADFVSAVTLSSFSKVLLIASTRTCISK